MTKPSGYCAWFKKLARDVGPIIVGEEWDSLGHKL